MRSFIVSWVDDNGFPYAQRSEECDSLEKLFIQIMSKGIRLQQVKNLKPWDGKEVVPPLNK